MAIIIDAIISKSIALLGDFFKDEVSMVLGVNEELQNLQKRMRSIQSLLKDAEKRKFDDSSIELWLSELKDVMYDVEDIIDLCRIEGTQLLADQKHISKNSRRRSKSLCEGIQNIPTEYGIGNRIREINDTLNRICENRERFKLEKPTISEIPKITRVDFRQTSPLVHPLVVGREVEDAASTLVDHLIGEKVDEKCRLFAVTGMGGVGKTTLAQKIFNHPRIRTFFNLDPVWVCVSQTYSEIQLLKQVIREAKGSYRDADTKSELQRILSGLFASGRSFFLVLDDVWRADVWVDLLTVPLCTSNVNVRVLVTTRDETVAKEMGAAYIHPVALLSEESSWDMLRKRLFSEGEEESANGLKELGFQIVERCGGLPLAIKAVSEVLARKERDMKEWKKVLRNDAWSVSKLPEGLSASLYLSFEDLPSHLKQCFLYFSLYPKGSWLDRSDFVQLWVAEGFLNEEENLLMEESAEECFNELLKRNLLLPHSDFEHKSRMHDLIRSLATSLSKEENSFGDLNVTNSTASIKLRRLSVVDSQNAAVQILESVADKGALRTLLASGSDLLLDDERLRQLSHLPVLDVGRTKKIEILPDSIGNLVHLKFLNLSFSSIRAIPESIKKLRNLQFLNIRKCENLTQLPSGITLLHNLRLLDLSDTPVSCIPQGIQKLQQLNYLVGFVVANNDSSSKLEELNSLKQIRTLGIRNLERAQSGTIILKELPYLSTLELKFSKELLVGTIPSEEQELAEKLLDEMIPPKSLEKFTIYHFFGRRFPNWMASSSFEDNVPYLTKLEFYEISSCTQFPPLGQLPELRELLIRSVTKVRKIGPEFLGGGVDSIAFPKLRMLSIWNMKELEDWSFGAQVEENATPRLKLLPCLQKLEISDCRVLRQLPKGLKYSAMKSLHINNCANLKTANCPPMLKKLDINECKALSFVENLDSLQVLQFAAKRRRSLPKWLLIHLRKWRLQNYINENFQLQLRCREKIFLKCLEEGRYWGLIQHIPQVIVYCNKSSDYLHYCKQPYVYKVGGLPLLPRSC